jgi:hypothetical protein
MAYSSDHSTFLLKTLYQTSSVITIHHEFRVNFECRKAPNRYTVNILIIMFEVTGIVTKTNGVVEKNKSVITLENIHCIE